MEYDRFQNNNKLYIFGIISLVLALTLFSFSIYIIPFMIWELHYNVPDVIMELINYFQENHNVSLATSKILVWLVFFIPSLVTGYISYYISNYIDDQIFIRENQMEELEEEKKVSSLEVRQQLKESASIGFKIIFLMILIVVVILLLQAFVQLTAP